MEEKEIEDIGVNFGMWMLNGVVIPTVFLGVVLLLCAKRASTPLPAPPPQKALGAKERKIKEGLKTDEENRAYGTLNNLQTEQILGTTDERKRMKKKTKQKEDSTRLRTASSSSSSESEQSGSERGEEEKEKTGSRKKSREKVRMSTNKDKIQRTKANDKYPQVKSAVAPSAGAEADVRMRTARGPLSEAEESGSIAYSQTMGTTNVNTTQNS